MRAERDEPFGLELTQRLAHRNSAHAELVGERVLAQRLALGIVAAENALAQRLDRHAGDRLPLNREHAWARTGRRGRIDRRQTGLRRERRVIHSPSLKSIVQRDTVSLVLRPRQAKKGSLFAPSSLIRSLVLPPPRFSWHPVG